MSAPFESTRKHSKSLNKPGDTQPYLDAIPPPPAYNSLIPEVDVLSFSDLAKPRATEKTAKFSSFSPCQDCDRTCPRTYTAIESERMIPAFVEGRLRFTRGDNPGELRVSDIADAGIENAVLYRVQGTSLQSATRREGPDYGWKFVRTIRNNDVLKRAMKALWSTE